MALRAFRTGVLLANLKLVASLFILFTVYSLFIQQPKDIHVIPKCIHEETQQEKQHDNTESETTCQFPYLDPFDPSISRYLRNDSADFECKKIQEDLSVVRSDGALQLLDKAKQYSCHYRFIHRINSRMTDDIELGEWFAFDPSKQIKFTEANAIAVRCLNHRHDIVYYNTHTHPMDLPLKSCNRDPDEMSVLLFVIDSLSNSMLYRQIPLTFAYLRDEMGAFHFNGFTKAGDNTRPNMLPIFTGLRYLAGDTDMPSELDEYIKEGYFDDVPFIWRRFEEKGYGTAWLGDEPQLGLAHYTSRGFKEGSPVQHDFRPYMLHRERSREDTAILRDSSRWCYGNTAKNIQNLDILQRTLRSYRGCSNFVYVHLTELTHAYINELRKLDQHLLQFFMRQKALLENTLLIFMGDHGNRFHPIRETLVGLLEERLPAYLLRLPPAFLQRHPGIAEALRLNQKRLTSVFDVHATLQDVLHQNYYASQRADGERGLSQFYEIPGNRTCRQAGIPTMFCVCENGAGSTISPSDRNAVRAGNAIIRHVNSLFREKRQCAQLELQSVERAEALSANGLVARGIREYVSNTTNGGSSSVVTTVRVLVRARPSGALLEGAVSLGQTLDSVINAVSRVNAYGNQSHCVHDERLKLYCFCDTIL